MPGEEPTTPRRHWLVFLIVVNVLVFFLLWGVVGLMGQQIHDIKVALRPRDVYSNNSLSDLWQHLVLEHQSFVESLRTHKVNKLSVANNDFNDFLTGISTEYWQKSTNKILQNFAFQKHFSLLETVQSLN